MNEIVNQVVSSDRKRPLSSINDMIQEKSHSLRNQLTDSTGIQATSKQLMEDLFDTNCGDDDGEIMLLAMILLQLHGKFPSAELQDEINKKKRQRTNPDQLAILEQIFQTDRMPSQQTRVQLADQLGMSSRRVQIWFQNKRAKVKRGISKSSESIVIGEDEEIDSVPKNPLSVSTTISAPLSSIHLSSSSSSSPSPSHSSMPFRFIPPPTYTPPSIIQHNSTSSSLSFRTSKSNNPLSLSSATVPVPPSSSSLSSLSHLSSIAEEEMPSPVSTKSDVDSPEEMEPRSMTPTV